MSVTDDFKEFIENLKIDNKNQISNRYENITRSLNRVYRDSESKTSNSLQVGSYGRFTAIKGVSDLDMIYEMPSSEWDRFKVEGEGRQSVLLQEIKTAIKKSYPDTKMRGDGQVVVVAFSNHVVEVVPGFKQTDDSYKYPNTKNGGKWKVTNPKAEIRAISDAHIVNSAIRHLCKMARAWKDRQGVNMGGLLIDTLVYNFLNSSGDFDDVTYKNYDELSRDFFYYLYNQPKQSFFKAPGSNQHVYVKSNFQSKAKKAYNLCVEAIKAEGKNLANKKWKQVFGRNFPSATITENSGSWRDTEEFIENKYPVNIGYSVTVDCEVSQKGFRTHYLTKMLAKKMPLLASKKLLFSVTGTGVPKPYHIEWKVLNQGLIAEQRDHIRGQILVDEGGMVRRETTSFKGTHIVDCYVIKDGTVVARESIDVPIQ